MKLPRKEHMESICYEIDRFSTGLAGLCITIAE